jgi:hypothetical protein
MSRVQKVGCKWATNVARQGFIFSQDDQSMVVPFSQDKNFQRPYSSLQGGESSAIRATVASLPCEPRMVSHGASGCAVTTFCTWKQSTLASVREKPDPEPSPLYQSLAVSFFSLKMFHCLHDGFGGKSQQLLIKTLCISVSALVLAGHFSVIQFNYMPTKR